MYLFINYLNTFIFFGLFLRLDIFLLAPQKVFGEQLSWRKMSAFLDFGLFTVSPGLGWVHAYPFHLRASRNSV